MIQLQLCCCLQYYFYPLQMSLLQSQFPFAESWCNKWFSSLLYLSTLFVRTWLDGLTVAAGSANAAMPR